MIKLNALIKNPPAMKKILLNGIILLFSISLFAQSPNYFNYQSVIRDNSGELIKNQDVSFRISIISGTETGPDVYRESHSVESNDFGLCNLKIGNGTDQTGNFNLIDWGIGNYYLKIELDENAGTDYTEMGTIQLLSVPYSLYANTASQAKFIDNDILYFSDSDTLFAVKDRDGNIVFAVFPDGVEIYVNESVKGKVGGFAVSGRSPSKAGEEDYFVVTADSTRIYVNQSETKGKVGGFAVSGRIPSKTTVSNFLDITPDNYFIGHESGQKTQNFVGSDHGKYNVFLGYQTGMENLTGLKNVFIGYKTAQANTHGMMNVYIGTESGYSNEDGYDNVFIGSSSGYSNTDGINNVFLGSNSGYTNETGEDNVFVGFESGYSNTTGIRNTFMGNKAGRANVDGNDNIFIGELAGFSNINGGENIFIGKRAGQFVESALENTLIGTYSGQQVTTGSENTFLGHRTGLGNTTGSQNTYIGGLASNRNDVGRENVSLGFNSGGWSYGSYNTYLGVAAGMNTVGEGNVFIGYNAGFNDTISNCLYIANNSYDSSLVLVYGQFDNKWLRINDALGVGRNPETYALEVQGDAYKTSGTSAWLITSDKRIKTNIRNIDNSFDLILKLNPVKYNYTEEWKKKYPTLTKQTYYSFIAQEYQEVFPESVKGGGEFLENDPDEILAIDVHDAQIVTIKAVQELIKENKLLKEKLEEQEKQYIELSKRLDIIEKRLNKN